MVIVCIFTNQHIMKPKILIVDDNEYIADVLSYILTNNGYDVVVLDKGEPVIDLVKHDHPDLVILDADLPDADGRVICHDLKCNDETKDLPVIMCSARDDIGESLHQQGAPDDILPKPFDMYYLIDCIKKQLKQAA